MARQPETRSNLFWEPSSHQSTRLVVSRAWRGGKPRVGLAARRGTAEVRSRRRAPSLAGAPALARKHTHGFGGSKKKKNKKKIPYRMRFFSSSIGSSPRSSLKLFDSLAAQRRDARPAGRAAAGALGATRGAPGTGGGTATAPGDAGTRGWGGGDRDKGDPRPPVPSSGRAEARSRSLPWCKAAFCPRLHC